jgi:hypothetical protein
MPYITNYNNWCMQESLKTSERFLTNCRVYKRPINIFNQSETNELLLFQLLISNANEVCDLINKDILIMRNKLPVAASYHYFKDCKRLNSDYIIAEKIKNEKGIVVDEIIHDVINNSGVLQIQFNIDIAQLEKEIDLILDKIDVIIEKDKLINQYAKEDFALIRTRWPQGLTENEKNRLLDFNTNYKKPVFKMLKEYYTIRDNPNFDFDEKILVKMGFKVCYTCSMDFLFNPKKHKKNK